MSTYVELGQKLADARYIAAQLPEPNATQRIELLMQLTNTTQTIAELVQTPNPTPADCDELRRLAGIIQEVLRYCPIVNPVPEM